MMRSIVENERWMQENEHELFPDGPHDHKNCRVCGPGPLKRNEVPSSFSHRFYKMVKWDDGYSFGSSRKLCGAADAEVVSSELDDGSGHTPMLDIDLPVRVIESSTPGHHHLYIDKKMSWLQYRRLLKALYKAGIIEKGWYQASLARRGTHLRPPWKEKDV